MSMKGSVTTADYLPYADYQKLVQTLINEKSIGGPVIASCLSVLDCVFLMCANLNGQMSLTNEKS